MSTAREYNGYAQLPDKKTRAWHKAENPHSGDQTTMSGHEQQGPHPRSVNFMVRLVDTSQVHFNRIKPQHLDYFEDIF